MRTQYNLRIASCPVELICTIYSPTKIQYSFVREGNTFEQSKFR